MNELVEVDVDRVLPYNLDAEKSLLGAIIIDNSIWPLVAAVVSGEDFFRKAHQQIFQRMIDLLEKGKSIDFIILKDALAKHGELDDVGGPAYLSALTDGLPHATNVQYYADIVREHARLRSAIKVASTVMEGAYAREADAADVIEAGVTGLLQIADATTATVTKVEKAISEYMTTLDDAGTTHQPIPCGYAEIDQLLGGWQRGQLIVVAARTSVGKSSFALGTAFSVARAGTPAAFVSLEMSRHVLSGQLLSWRSGVPAERVRRKTVNDLDYQKIGEAFAVFGDIPLYIIEATRTLTQVAAWSRRLRDQHAVGAIVVDYLQLLMHETNERGEGRRRHEVSAVSRGLKRIATDLGVVVIALSQLNRAPEGRTDKRPHLSDLRESGNIEQDADIALLLYREEMHKRNEENEGVAEAIVAKNRSGPTGTVKLYFDKNLAMFRDLAR